MGAAHLAFVPSRWSQSLLSQTAALLKESHSRINWSGRGFTFRAQVSVMTAAPCRGRACRAQ